MTFEYIVNKQNKKLSDDQIEYVAKSVSSDFKEFDRQRSKNLNMAQALSKKIFFSEETFSKAKSESWKK